MWWESYDLIIARATSAARASSKPQSQIEVEGHVTGGQDQVTEVTGGLTQATFDLW